MITGEQIRTARKMLNWAPDLLARRLRVPAALIAEAEAEDGPAPLPHETAWTLRRTLELQGLEFRDDPASRPVRWRRRSGPALFALRQSA